MIHTCLCLPQRKGVFSWILHNKWDRRVLGAFQEDDIRDISFRLKGIS